MVVVGHKRQNFIHHKEKGSTLMYFKFQWIKILSSRINFKLLLKNKIITKEQNLRSYYVNLLCSRILLTNIWYSFLNTSTSNLLYRNISQILLNSKSGEQSCTGCDEWHFRFYCWFAQKFDYSAIGCSFCQRCTFLGNEICKIL